MVLRIETLQTELPAPKRRDPKAAAALQEWLGGKIHPQAGVPSAFTPDYAPEEIFEIAAQLYKKSR